MRDQYNETGPMNSRTVGLSTSSQQPPQSVHPHTENHIIGHCRIDQKVDQLTRSMPAHILILCRLARWVVALPYAQRLVPVRTGRRQSAIERGSLVVQRLPFE